MKSAVLMAAMLAIPGLTITRLKEHPDDAKNREERSMRERQRREMTSGMTVTAPPAVERSQSQGNVPGSVRRRLAREAKARAKANQEDASDG